MVKLTENYNQNKSVEENLPPVDNQETNETPTSSRTCSRFDNCSAPLCPADQGSLNGSQWYCDEEICTAHAFSGLPWLKQQRKIARKVRNKDFYFNYEMLNRNCVITVATEGLDPDKDIVDTDSLVKRWLNKHPEKKAKTKEEIDLLRNRMAGIRKGLTTKKNDQSAEEIKKKDANPLGVLETSLPQQYESVTKEGNTIITREIN